MKNLRKQILTLAEAENGIKLPAGFKKPEGWDDEWDKESQEYYLKKWNEQQNYLKGNWKKYGGLTIPQIISKLQQIYRQHGDIRTCVWNEDDRQYDLVDSITYDKTNNLVYIGGDATDIGSIEDYGNF